MAESATFLFATMDAMFFCNNFARWLQKIVTTCDAMCWVFWDAMFFCNNFARWLQKIVATRDAVILSHAIFCNTLRDDYKKIACDVLISWAGWHATKTRYTTSGEHATTECAMSTKHHNVHIRVLLKSSFAHSVVACSHVQHATKTLEKCNNISFEPKWILKVPTYSSRRQLVQNGD